jgi:hypothetical protein
MKNITMINIRISEIKRCHIPQILSELAIKGLIQPQFLLQLIHLTLIGIRPQNGSGWIGRYDMEKDKRKEDNPQKYGQIIDKS